MAVSPKIETMIKDDQPIEVLDLVLHLQENAPHILETQLALTQAQEIREQIDVERLTPKYKRIIINRIDPLFGFATKNFSVEDAITLLHIAPTLLGSGEAGPQTYLILIQNEDELRPTGGFLTAVGNAVVREGEVSSIEFQSSDRVDDLEKPFPIPPWQFREFMGIEMFLFRDSNWFTDFPTTASWAEYFYTYSGENSSDGMITIDMQVIVRLLEVLGPVRIEKVSVPITAKNVKDYLRSAEESGPEK
jgi:hypothetical protein